jgi:hypothetical protein
MMAKPARGVGIASRSLERYAAISVAPARGVAPIYPFTQSAYLWLYVPLPATNNRPAGVWNIQASRPGWSIVNQQKFTCIGSSTLRSLR